MREQVYCRYCGRKLHKGIGGRTGTQTEEYGKVHLICAKRIEEKENK